MNLFISATELNLIGKMIYGLYNWVGSWTAGIEIIGAFGVTVILFTIILKVITTPFDVWQKKLARKTSKSMDAMKPELDKITKQCGNNKEMLYQKQRGLYKQFGYSPMASCLPMILQLVIFMVVFTGFNSTVRYYNSKQFDDLQNVFDQTYEQKETELRANDPLISNVDVNIAATAEAEKSVLKAYKLERFLLTKNIFMADTWVKPIPTVESYSGTGMGNLGIKGMDKNTYNRIMNPIIKEYNDDGWNGFLVLPILTFILSIFSSKLNKIEQPAVPGQTDEQKKMAESQQKMMTYMMPLMFGIFTVFYSTAFTLYMFLSNVITTIFNLVYNKVAKNKDDAEKAHRLATTIKK